MSECFCEAGVSLLRERPKGNKNRRTSAIALWKPSAPLLLGLFAVGLCHGLVNE